MGYKLRILACLCVLLMNGKSNIHSSTPYNDAIFKSEYRKNEKVITYRQWCSFVDSLTKFGKSTLSHKNVESLLEKASRLNKEKKVYESLKYLFEDKSTLYMMVKMNKRTSNVFIACWKRVPKGFDIDPVNYRYYKYQKRGPKSEEFQYADSVHIKKDPDRPMFSEKILKICNSWDVQQLVSNRDMDGVYGKDVSTIAYRIDFYEKRKYKLTIVSVISQGGDDAEVQFPYEIIER